MIKNVKQKDRLSQLINYFMSRRERLKLHPEQVQEMNELFKEKVKNLKVEKKYFKHI